MLKLVLSGGLPARRQQALKCAVAATALVASLCSASQYDFSRQALEVARVAPVVDVLEGAAPEGTVRNGVQLLSYWTERPLVWNEGRIVSGEILVVEDRADQDTASVRHVVFSQDYVALLNEGRGVVAKIPVGAAD